jgi:hypothetical protein
VNIRRRELAWAGALALLFGAAPTVGDVGSCGRAATDLDQQTFASARKAVDCRRCSECRLTSQICPSVCDPNVPSDVGWPATCHPLEHDGEVCLRALRAASCNDYAGFLSDVAPSVPTECDFCHLIPEAGILAGDR